MFVDRECRIEIPIKHSSILAINDRNRTSSIARSRSAVIRMFFLHGSQGTLGGFAASPILGEMYHIAVMGAFDHGKKSS